MARDFLSILLSFSSLPTIKLPSCSGAPFTFCSSPVSLTGLSSHKSLLCLILSWPLLLRGAPRKHSSAYVDPGNTFTFPAWTSMVLPEEKQLRTFRIAQEEPDPHGSLIPVPTFGTNCTRISGSMNQATLA